MGRFNGWGDVVLCALVGMLLITFSGCSSVEKGPISSSLTRLHYETSRYSGTIFDHDEVLSASGLLPVPGVAWGYHFPRGAEMSTSIGLAASQSSFALVGQSEPGLVSLKDVLAVRSKLEEIRRLTSAALAILAQIDSGNPDLTSLESLKSDYKSARDSIEARTKEFWELVSKDGIIVASWQTNRSAKTWASASEVATIGSSRDTASRGVIVLGGIRVTYLFFGGDFAGLVGKIAPSTRRNLGYVSMTTYALQAQHVAYLSDAEAHSDILAKIQLQPEAVSRIARSKNIQVEMMYLAESYSRLTNIGTISEFTWTRQPLPFEANQFIDDPYEEAWAIRDNLDELQDRLLRMSPGWKTIVAQLTTPGRFMRLVFQYYPEGFDR